MSHFHSPLIPAGSGSDAARASPAVVVCRIVPYAPTAHPVFASVKKTPDRPQIEPVDCRFHVAPPSVVRRMVLMPGPQYPRPPTTNPVFAPVNDTPLSRFVTPLDCSPQLAPPSVVRRMMLLK